MNTSRMGEGTLTEKTFIYTGVGLVGEDRGLEFPIDWVEMARVSSAVSELLAGARRA